ncbi:Transglutaminase-like enzyme, putative cysteine protease [Dyadobacter sp. SG02]|uniref:transglutaminase family protein n=1 Tax=Dyadobacter sp. SG02 TaxID=1855291 RepID=UPI0008ACF5BD|nr:transglutaminase family protein [Dyadobacter sp. SG02]SEJ79873.1 Transglutaminase-like enzyme, putative cysteine protease [Dyadobacter sp. SG02]
MTLISISHKTVYTYDRSVFLSPHQFRLRPTAHSSAQIESYALMIQPDSHTTHWQQDVFGNFIARVDFDGPMESMTLTVRIDALLTPYDPFNVRIDDYAQHYPFQYPFTLHQDLLSYLEIIDHGPNLALFIQQLNLSDGDILGFLVSLNNRVFTHINYLKREEEGVWSSEQTLKERSGSCRDSAWLLVQVTRHLGLASRFVSGYLVQSDQRGLPVSVDLHAWAEVFIPGAGWIGLDTTSGLFTSEGHIPLAATPRPVDSAPVTGTTSPCVASIRYETKVHPQTLSLRAE